MVGNIGSGKSTKTKKLVKQKGFVCVSRDAIRYMLGSGKYIFDPKLEPLVFRITKICVEQFLKNKINVILDETNISKSIRKVWIKLGKQYKYKIITYVMPRLTIDKCIKRRMISPHSKESKRQWEKVWEYFDLMYSEPSKKEGINKIIKL